MKVLIGKVKTAKEILGGDVNVTAFVIVRDGHHYMYNEPMNAWGVTKLVCCFVPRESRDHPHYNLIGTLAGDSAFNFLTEWLEGVFEQEIADDDPRAMTLARAQGGHGMSPEDFLKKLLGGE